MKETPPSSSGGSRANHPYHGHRPPSTSTGQRAANANAQRPRNSRDHPIEQDPRRYPSTPADAGGPPLRYSSTQAPSAQHGVDHSIRRDFPPSPTPRGQQRQVDYGVGSAFEEVDDNDSYHDAQEWPQTGGMADGNTAGHSSFEPAYEPEAFEPPSSYDVGLRPSTSDETYPSSSSDGPPPPPPRQVDQPFEPFEPTDVNSRHYGNPPETLPASQNHSSESVRDLIDLRSEASEHGDTEYPQRRRTATPDLSRSDWSGFNPPPTNRQTMRRRMEDVDMPIQPMESLSSAFDQRLLQQAVMNLTQSFQNLSQSQAAVNFAMQNLTQSQTMATAAMQSLCQMLLQK